LTNDEIVRAIAENEQRSKSNSHRISNLEDTAKLLNKMVTALEVLAAQQKTVAEHVEKIDGKVTRLEQSPMKKISTIIGYVLAAVCSAGAGVILSYFGQ